jgi:hypothetical protein
MQHDLRERFSAVTRFGPWVTASYRVVVNDLRAFTGFDLEITDRSARVLVVDLPVRCESSCRRRSNRAEPALQSVALRDH